MISNQKMGRKTLLAAVMLALTGCGGPPLPEEQREGTIESQQILDRDLVTSRAEVQHILIGWKDLAGVYGAGFDPRAAGRTREQAEKLVLDILRRARSGEEFEKLMAEHSEDPETAETGETYIASLTSPVGPEFTKLGMRLYLGEVGVIESRFGYHIIKRLQ